MVIAGAAISVDFSGPFCPPSTFGAIGKYGWTDLATGYIWITLDRFLCARFWDFFLIFPEVEKTRTQLLEKTSFFSRSQLLGKSLLGNSKIFRGKFRP